MTTPGPDIQYLVHRLTAAPRHVTETAEQADDAETSLTAVIVSDLLFDLGGDILSRKELEYLRFKNRKERRNLLMTVRLAAYVLADSWFMERARVRAHPGLAAKAQELFLHGLTECASAAPWDYFLNDPEGREELCRRVLAALELVPAGETAQKAADRLTALDSVERARVIRDMREAEKRARELREAMARREAEEAASKMSRE